MDFLFALLLSFLPPRYRKPLEHKARTHLTRAAQTSAFFELVIVAIFYARGLVDYFPSASVGPAAFLEYFFTWQGLILAFFFCDGALRLLASFSGETLGTMPLYAAAWIHDWWDRREAKKRELPLVADIVEVLSSATDELRIRSCRPRKNWDKWMTVMYEEKLYEIASAELGDPARPYVYLLRPKPESKVIRGLHRYHPDEVFRLEND